MIFTYTGLQKSIIHIHCTNTQYTDEIFEYE